MKRFIYLFLFLLCISQDLLAQYKFWTGATSNDWNTASNWNPASVPTASDVLYIGGTANRPIIQNGILAAASGMIVNSNSLTIASGGALTLGGGVAIQLENASILNNGTVSWQGQVFSFAGATNITNTGMIIGTLMASRNNSNLTLTNTSTGVLSVSTYLITAENAALTLINSGTAIVSNITNLDGTGKFFVTNNACGRIIVAGSYDNTNNSITTNEGLIQIGGALNNSSGTFTNNSTLKYNSGSGNAVVNVTNPSLIVKNTPTPIFIYGGTYNGTVNGIFTNSTATTSAGAFTAPNSFTPAGLPAGVRTLYASITPSGGGCTYIVPFTYNVIAPSFTTVPTSKTVCSTSGTTFTVAASNATSYQWQVNTGSGGFTDLNNTAPYSGVTGPTLTISSVIGLAGYQYRCVATGNGLSTNSTAAILTVTPDPDATISYVGASFCSNESAMAVTLIGTTGGTYTATPAGLSIDATTGQITPASSTPQSYTVIYTIPASGGCAQLTTTASVAIYATPTANILTPASTTLTCSNPTLSLTATGGETYRWSTGATSQTIDVSVADIYSVTVTSANGCSSTATATVTSNQVSPTVSINPSSTTLTCLSPIVSLSAIGNGTYRWSNGETSSNISVTAEGTYSLTLTSTNGCSSTASASVSADQTPPLVSISPTNATLTCTNPVMSLSAVGSGTYRWSTGVTTAAISVSVADTYSVTLTGANGCLSTASANVSVDQTQPSVSISPSIGTPTGTTLTCTSSVVILSAIGTGTYQWSTGAITQTISATSAGTYSVTLTGTNGCSSSATITVDQNVSAPVVSITPTSATLTCASPAVSLSAIGAGTYQWSNGATASSISVSAPGTYSVTLTGDNGCSNTTSVAIYQDITPPSVSISPTSATLTCTTPAVSLSMVGSGPFQWNTGAITPVISATSAGGYSVILTGTNGCTATASAQVTQDLSMPDVTIATPSTTIAMGQSITLTASGATTYLWSTGDSTNPIVVNSSGIYSVTGTTGICQKVASVNLVSSGPFAIASVTTNNCQQIAANRYVVSFTPQYTGSNGRPISFSVVNEIFPTTAPGPYTLQLYDDNAAIVLKAIQPDNTGEASFTYNWLANCQSPQPNTPPRVNQPLTDQIARVGEGFGYTLPQVTFTDNESPQSLVLSVSGLPAGLSFSLPTQIGGVPSVTGVSTITVTATDPQGLSVATSFRLTVVEQTATNTPPTLVNPVGPQVATQGQPFGLNLSNTFTDAQTPTALTLTASELPSGLQLVAGQLSGTPSLSGTSTITLTATDPGGLSASIQFSLLVQPASVTATVPFAITSVSPITCNQISANRYAISFQPQYSGLNGQTINFWVVNELVPTTASGPYSLQLYNDNAVIVLKARQEGSAGEASYSYNWLAVCGNPVPNTPPRVNQSLSDQTAQVGQAFGYTIPQLTFTDNESSQSLVLSVSGLPAGMSFSPPTQIGGVPSVSGISSVTVTATDPGGLSVYTTFQLTVLPAGQPSGFAITGVQTLSCASASGGRRLVTFTPQYSGLDGSPVSFSIVNELLPTTNSGPYTLELYADNPTLRLRAQQSGATTSYDYNWLAACNTPARKGVAETGTGLQVKVLGNPVTGSAVELEISGVTGQSVAVSIVDMQGHQLAGERIQRAVEKERLSLRINQTAGVLLLDVHTAVEHRMIRLLQK